MRGLGRRNLPEDLLAAYAAFRRCAEHIDLAQRAMLRCVPSSARSVALPLEVGAETLRLSLAQAGADMPAWRHPAVDDEWHQCERALADTLAGVDTAVAAASRTRELEVALTAVQDLIEPLHAFVDAEARFVAMRRSRRTR